MDDVPDSATANPLKAEIQLTPAHQGLYRWLKSLPFDNRLLVMCLGATDPRARQYVKARSSDTLDGPEDGRIVQ